MFAIPRRLSAPELGLRVRTIVRDATTFGCKSDLAGKAFSKSLYAPPQAAPALAMRISSATLVSLSYQKAIPQRETPITCRAPISIQNRS